MATKHNLQTLIENGDHPRTQFFLFFDDFLTIFMNNLNLTDLYLDTGFDLYGRTQRNILWELNDVQEEAPFLIDQFSSYFMDDFRFYLKTVLEVVENLPELPSSSNKYDSMDYYSRYPSYNRNKYSGYSRYDDYGSSSDSYPSFKEEVIMPLVRNLRSSLHMRSYYKQELRRTVKFGTCLYDKNYYYNLYWDQKK